MSSEGISPGPTPVPLNRAVSVLIGVLFGTTISVVFGIAVAITIVSLVNSGPLRPLWSYLEMATAMILVWPIASGLFGGMVCGLLRGERVYLAWVSACVPAIFATLASPPQGTNISEFVVIGVSLVLVALPTAATYCLLLRRIARKRDAVIQTMREDPTASPGKSQALLATSIALVLVISGCAGVLFLGRPGSDYVLGLVVSGCWINILCGLHLVGSFPNRARVGWVTTILSFLVAMLAAMFVEMPKIWI